MPKKPRCHKCNSIIRSSTGSDDQLCHKCKTSCLKSNNQQLECHANSNKNYCLNKHNCMNSTEAQREPQIWEANMAPTTQFQKQHPQYCQNGIIHFPIEDFLFDQYKEFLEPFHTSSSSTKPILLPPHFQPILEIWNVLKTFPEYFNSPTKIMAISDLELIILNDEEYIDLMCKIFDIFAKDFACEKNQLIKKSKYFDFFSLLKFCTENGFLNKIYKRCWPSIAFNFFFYFSSKEQNQQQHSVRNILQQLSQNCASKCPENIEHRCSILAVLIRFLVETNEFRVMLGLKIDAEKKQHKKSIELQEQRKKLQKQLLRINEKQKLLQKQQKSFNKEKAASSEIKSVNTFSHELQMIRTLKAESLLNLEKINEDLNSFSTNKTRLTNVQHLGLDKDKNIYWSIPLCPDKVFVSSNGVWSYFEIEHIPNLMGNLNLRGVRQNNLYKVLNNLVQSNSSSQVGPSSKLFTEFQQTVWQPPNGSSVSTQQIYDQMKTLLIENETKLTLYLDERNSKWGTASEKQNFVHFASNMKNLPLKNVLEELRSFNEKICVVETEYKIINECSSEQIDIRSRKVQTKIWGISQKYKLNWTQFSETIQNLYELFFLVYVLCLNIEKYTSKNRKKRKQFEFVKEANRFLKTVSCRKDELDWEQVCDECKEGGQLLCCDICPKVFHLVCLEMTEMPEQRFQCENCTKDRNLRKLLRKSKI